MDTAKTPSFKHWLSYWKVSVADHELGRGVFTARQMQTLQASVLPRERIEDQQIANTDNAWLENGASEEILSMATLRDWFARDPGAVMRDSEGAWLQGVVYPFVYLLEKRHERGYAKRQFVPQALAPVSMTVRIYEDGRIYPEGRPGVPRELLDPANGARPFVIGTVDDLDAFFDQNPFPEWEDPLSSRWTLNAVIEYCQRMVEQICTVDLSAPMGESGPRYTYLGEALIHKGRANSGAIRPLLGVYDMLMSRDVEVDTVRRLTHWDRRRRLNPGIEKSITTRTASMEGVALSADQKYALTSALRVGEGEVQAINGPPGTGKTTVIKDIVASLVGQAALEKKAPPLIVIASNNNQAVTNVLDVFSRPDGQQRVNRWIGGWHSFGVYAPALSRSEDAQQQGYATLETMRELERSHQPQHAEHQFLSKASQWAGRSVETLEQAEELLHRRIRHFAATLRQVRQLHQRIASVDRRERLNAARVVVKKLNEATGGKACPQAFHQLRQWLNNMERYLDAIERARGRREWIMRKHDQLQKKVPAALLSALGRNAFLRDRMLPLLASDIAYEAGSAWADVVHRRVPSDAVSDNQQALKAIGRSPDWQWVIEALDDALNESCRSGLFEASVHWFEAQWLRQMRSVNSERQRNGRTYEVVNEALKRRSMIAPVMVGTFYTLPRHLSYWDAIAQSEFALTQRADYLLVDEAGQASTEVAVPTIALAKRLVSIGDIHQLAPVRQVARPIDLANLVATGVVPPASDSRALESVLGPFEAYKKLAQSSSLLDMVRPLSALHDSKTNPVGAQLVKHRRCVPSIIQFCNRLCYDNELEPQRQPQGLDIEGVRWMHVGGFSERQRGSLVNRSEAGVIAQWVSDNAALLLEQYEGMALGDIVGVVTPFTQQAHCIRGALGEAGIDHHTMTIGTIHSLQGAERPVIVLSLVYTHPASQALFFDVEPQMLNVAVSRARDALVVAGDMNALYHGDRPSRILLEHLHNHIEPQRLPRTASKWWLADRDDERAFLETRDAHDEFLEHLLDSHPQWQQLWIASPVFGLQAAKRHGAKMVEAAARGSEIHLLISRQHSMINGYERALKELLENLRRGGVAVHVLEWFEGSWLRVDKTMVSLTDGDWLSQMPEARDWGIQRGQPCSRIVQGETARRYLPSMVEPANSGG